MRNFIPIFSLMFFFSFCSHAAMTASGCKEKIRSAYQSRTGKTLDDGSNNVLIDICKGIIDEIQANAKVQVGISVNIPSTSSPGTPSTGSTNSQGTIQ